MASVTTDMKLRKPLPKPLMLKDYLLDDLSSCSSNGFRSYPRQQCCKTVRFLIEDDLKYTQSSTKKKPLLKNRSKSASSTISAFQRASEAVINAVKQLPFTGVKSPSKENKLKKTILPRSLSKKLLRRSFWKKTDHKEIQRWRSFREFLEEKSKPSEFSRTVTTITTTAATTTTDSNSSSNNNSKTNSWSDSDFISSDYYLQCSSGNSEINSGANNVVVESKTCLVSKRLGVTVGDDSTEATSNNSSVDNTKNEWTTEEKEQLSPVSILDFPFHDEEEVSSSFQHSLDHMEGTNQKFMQKIRRFESLAQLEPVDLDKRILLLESDQESTESPLQPYLASNQEKIVSEKEEEENETEQKALELLKLMKVTIPLNSFKFKADNVMLDFFREGVTEAIIYTTSLTSGMAFDNELLDVAKDWINGQPPEFLLEWEVERNRQTYIREIEMAGRWINLDKEKEEMVSELEFEVFSSLMNELLVELFSS